MNTRRRQIIAAAGAMIAGGAPSFVSAASRVPIIAYIGDDRPPTRADFENVRRALDLRFANARIKPKLEFVTSVVNRNDETRVKLRLDLENLRPTIVIARSPTHADLVRDFKMGAPILFFYLGNPIARRLTDSLARPSLGMTGYVLGPSSLIKRREMLLRLMPQCRTLGIFDLEFEPGPVLYNDSIIENDPFTQLKKRFYYCSTVSEFEEFARGRAVGKVDAWDIPWSRFAVAHGEEMAREFSRIRIPVMYPRLHFLKLGGMAAVQPNTDESGDVFAAQVVALLDGVPIENIPIVQSTRYNFGLNLQALRKVGINPPISLIKVADVVIQ